MSVALFETPQPLMVPGYTGYVPQYRFRVGETFGKTTHKTMMDPHINMAEKLVLSDRSTDDYQVVRPTENDLDIIQSRMALGDPVYKHPVIPGYEGFLPRIRGQFGQRYTAAAAAALSDLERQQRPEREARHQLTRAQQLQNNAAEPRNLLDRMVQANQWKMPLYMVRPEMTGVIRHVCAPEPAVPPARNTVSPYFMDPNDPAKYFMLGYTGHVPFGMARYGQTSQALTNSALCDFTHHYRRRQSTEWAPVGVVQPDPPLLLSPAEIYHKHVGMLPHYNGHLPGAKFRYGRTYGNDSRDGKRWLRGDYTT